VYRETSEPLIVVVNPTSTGVSKVGERVISPLLEENRLRAIVETRFRRTEDNINDMIDRLPDNATVINAAGDGTAMQLVNASILGSKNLTLGFMDRGNFSDLAHAHKMKRQTILDLANAPTVESTPLSIEVNGDYFRHAPAYVTLGLTALVAKDFDQPRSREIMRQAPGMLRKPLRLSRAALSYVHYGRKKIPGFHLNSGNLITGSTDIAIANNPVVAGMIRPAENYYDTPYFGYRADLNMTNPLKAAIFGIPSLFSRARLNTAEQMTIRFEEVTSVPLQTEGEFTQLADVADIFIYKDPTHAYKVLHPKA
jgi:hypothetical protein